MTKKSMDKLEESKQETLMNSWKSIESKLTNKHLNKEALDILEKIQNPKTTYFEIKELINRIHFLTSYLKDGKTEISIHISYRILEMNADYLTFVQLCNQYEISLRDNSFWENRSFQTMEDYFLYKDFGIIPVYKLDKPYFVFWDLTQRAANVRKPRTKWLELIRPYIFNHEFMEDLNWIYEDITAKIKKVEPKITKPEIDQIIYMGEKFFNRFLKHEEIIPTPLPENEIIIFEGIKLQDKFKYQQVKNYSQFLDYGIEPSIINKTTKEKLILTL